MALFIRSLIIILIIHFLYSCNYFNKNAIGNIEFGVTIEEFHEQKKLYLSNLSFKDSIYDLDGYRFKDIEGQFYNNKLYALKIKHIPLKYRLVISPADRKKDKLNESLEYSNIEGNSESINNIIRALNEKYTEIDLDMVHEYNYPDTDNRVKIGEWENYFKNISLYRILIPENKLPGFDIKDNIYSNYEVNHDNKIIQEIFASSSFIRRELVDTTKIYEFDSYILEIKYKPIIKEMENDSNKEFKSKIDSLSKNL